MNKKISLKSRIVGWFYAKKYAVYRMVKLLKSTLAYFKAIKRGNYNQVIDAAEQVFPVSAEGSRFYHGLLENSVVSSESYDLPNKTVTIKFEMK